MFIKKSNNSFFNLYKNILIYNYENLTIYIYIYKNYFFYYIFSTFKRGLTYYTKYQFVFNKLSFYKFDLYKAFNSLSFCELYVDGLYYRIKYYVKYNVIGFILGYNHYILYKLPDSIRAAVHMKKRRFFLFGFDLILLGNVANELVNLKYPNLFKGKGLKIISKNYRRKLLVKKTK